MRAAVLVAPESLELVDTPRPVPAAGQALVQVEACGICGSDLAAWRAGPQGGHQRPGAGGHEIVGTVVDGLPDLEGRRVVVDPTAVGTCGRCAPCLERAHWFCESRTDALPGAFLEFLAVPRHALHVVPETLALDLAVLSEPVACGLHALRSSWTVAVRGSLEGAHVVVIGAGMLGLGAVLAAGELGAAQVTVVAKHPHQARAARAAGAHDVLDAAEAATEHALRALRPSVVVEAVGGNGAALALGLRTVGRRGELVVLGGAPGNAVALSRATQREIRLCFPVAYAATSGAADLDLALDVLDRRQGDVGGWTAHAFSLEEVGAAFEQAADKSSGAVRVLVVPDGQVRHA
jgi:threonine dehydrogenase-like Zn-dependent dehydrogenase